MKWTTLLCLLILESSIAQNSIAFIKTATPPAPLPKGFSVSTAVLPLEIKAGMVFVQASADAQSGRYLLDTGAPSLILNQSISDADSYVAASSLGTTFQMANTKVKTFKWASIERKNVAALSLDIHHLEEFSNVNIKGIIGYDILKEVELYVDYSNAQLLLLQPGKNNLHCVATPILAVPFKLEDHLPVIQVKIGSQILRLGLDTGSGINLLSAQFEYLLKAHLLEAMHQETVQSIDQSSAQLQNSWIDNTQVADCSFGKMKYAFADLSSLKTGKAWEIDGVLGYPFFSRLKWSIDYANQMFYIWEVAP